MRLSNQAEIGAHENGAARVVARPTPCGVAIPNDNAT